MWTAVGRAASTPDGTRAQQRPSYTPLHGVGAAVLRAGVRAGRVRRRRPRSPSRPSPTRTSRPCAFPNPEEPGALDLALGAGRSGRGADLAARQRPGRGPLRGRGPGRAAAGWRPLRGDELGVLLGRPPDPPRPHRHVRHHDRVLVAAVEACAPRAGVPLRARRSPASSGSCAAADGPRATGTRRRSATASRRTWSGTRTASPPRCGRRARRRAARPRAARCSTGWTSWPPSSACTSTEQLSVRVDDLRQIAEHDGRAPGRPAAHAARPAGDRRRTCCRTRDVLRWQAEDGGWWSGRAGPSRSSRRTWRCRGRRRPRAPLRPSCTAVRRGRGAPAPPAASGPRQRSRLRPRRTGGRRRRRGPARCRPCR